MLEEGPDRTETEHESLVNAIAKYCSGSDLSMICTYYITVFSLRYWLLRVSDSQNNSNGAVYVPMLHLHYTHI